MPLFRKPGCHWFIFGSAVGFVSVIGYTPDVFMDPLIGYMLDSNPGIVGHQNLFGVLAIFGLIGLVSSVMFRRSMDKQPKL